MSTRLTAVLGLFVLVMLSLIWAPRFAADGNANLHYPGQLAGRMTDRHLEFLTDYDALPDWQKEIFSILFGEPSEIRGHARGVAENVLDYLAESEAERTPWSVTNMRARLAVLYAESGQWADLNPILDELDQAPDDSVVADAIRYAYRDAHDLDERDALIGLRMMPLGWASDTLQVRIAERARSPSYQDRARARLSRHGAQQRTRILWFALGIASIFMLAAALQVWQGTRLWTPIRANPMPLWRVSEGIGVLVRAGLLGLLIFIFINAAASYLKPHFFAAWSTLFASIPMLWFMQRKLFRPVGGNLFRELGIVVSLSSIPRVIAATLVIIAVERSGAMFISWGAAELGWQSHWSEGLSERWIWGPWSITLLSAVDAVVWAPLFEEIGFRGLIYLSLRTRMKPWQAAMLSSGAFALLHCSSLVVFISVFWSGLVWAYAFERLRSLLPVILAHASVNMMAVGSVLLFYR